jgi:hypothetical protein
MPEYFPAVLFATSGALCIALAIAEWKVRRRLAISLLALGGFSLVCLASNHAWARYSIRVDLLLTIPAVSIGALVAGTLATMRPPLPARMLGAMLALGGAVSFVWFSYAMHASSVEGARTMALSDEGNRLYWAETVRCKDNFEKRFGPLQRVDDPCVGNLVVQSRSPNSYPFTRIVNNDRGEAQLLFSPDSAMERPVALSRGVFAKMTRADNGEWTGEGDSGFGRTQISLSPQTSGRCAARIEHRGFATSILSTQRIELPNCPAMSDPPVTYLGGWGEVVTDPSGARRLLQIWLWAEKSGQANGVLANAVSSSGVRRDFIFLKHFHATRMDGDKWNLEIEEPDMSVPQSLTMTIEGESARVSGPQNFVGPGGETTLQKQEIVSDPRIELVPVRNSSLFERYLDTACSISIYRGSRHSAL